MARKSEVVVRRGSQVVIEKRESRRASRQSAEGSAPIVEGEVEIVFPERPRASDGNAERRRRRKARRDAETVARTEGLHLAPAPTFTEQALALPRIWRIALVSLFALAVTLAVTPIVDNFYVNNFFSMDTRLLPSLFSVGLGIVTYAVGWRLLIGMVGDAPQPRKATLWYLTFGIVMLVLVLILAGVGVFGNLSQS
jgi:hypothetical protein